MKRLSVIFAVSVALLSVAAAQSAAKPAEEVLASARAKAKAERKNVFVIFHASWCGWCKKLDEFMNKPQFKPFFDANYVIARIAVMESKEKKALENPGGDAVKKALGGEAAGLPFFAITDPAGKKLADSNMPVEGKRGQNIGHPVKPEEIAHFMKVITATAARATKDRLAAMRSFLEQQKLG